MTDPASAGAPAERRTLWIVLMLNVGIALAFLIAGISGDSSALLANGLDNLSDAAVYALSLIASIAGTKVSESTKAQTSAMMTVSAIGVNVLPSTPVSVSSGT